MTSHLRATRRHSPYGITQCYLPPDTSELAPPITPARQAGTRFIYPGGMEGWVDLDVEVANLLPTLWTCYRETDVMDFGLKWVWGGEFDIEEWFRLITDHFLNYFPSLDSILVLFYSLDISHVVLFKTLSGSQQCNRSL